MQSSTQEAKKHLIANVLTNMLLVFVSAVINIWLTPYLINHLGLKVYGMIPLVISFIAYFNLFTISISSSVSRYVAIHFGKGQLDKSNTYFNSALIALLGFCVVLLIPVIVLSLSFSAIFRVPQGYESDAGWLFFYIMLSSFFLAIASTFHVSTFVRHRFDISNAVTIGSSLLRLGVTVACFTYLAPSLRYFGFAYSVMAFFYLLSFIALTRILTPQIRIDFKLFNWKALLEMGRMSGWIAVNQVGAILYLSVSFIIINLFLGSEQVGRYGPIAQLVVLLISLGAALSNVFAPIAFDYIARNRTDILVLQMRRSTKFLGLMIGFAMGLICGLANPILTRWLGPSFADLSPLVWLLVGPWQISISVKPMYSMFRGFDKVKVPGIVTLIGGIVNVCLSIVLVCFTELGIYGVALALLICLASKNLLFTPVYAAVITGCPPMTFIKDIIPGIVMSLSVTLCGIVLSRTYDLATIPRLLAVSVLMFPVYGLISYFVFLKRDDRMLLWSIIFRRRSLSES